MSEEIKQEGDFKIAKKKTPRNLTKQDEIIKVDFSQKEQDITKVVIPNVELEEVIVINKVDLDADSVVIEEITDLDPITVVEKEVFTQKEERNLPENVEKLVSFMEETGGTVEDYVRLNADYSNTDETTLLKEYYKRTKPHLDREEIEFLIEDEFTFDEDLDEEREIRKKKLAFKEEVAKAKNHLESIKSKYYDEIKLRPGVTQEQKEAFDFFNRYKKNEEESKTRHDRFKQETKSLFSNDFKGFEYNVGEKRFRYSVQNTDQVADSQSDISNFVGKFLDSEGNVSDTKNYHKALYTAMHSDKIAQHFYEQGKADAIKEVVINSKNPANSQPRQASGEVFINGLKVKAISGMDSSKLKIQTKRFNN